MLLPDAPATRSLALIVVNEPELLVVPVPTAPTEPSRELDGASPLYSRTRPSAYGTAALNATVTVFVPAAAAAMLLAT